MCLMSQPTTRKNPVNFYFKASKHYKQMVELRGVKKHNSKH